MKPGDLVKRKAHFNKPDEFGLFVGMRTFKASKHDKNPNAEDYTCAEVMWFAKRAPNGDRISTVQTDLIEVVSEDR